MIAPTVIDDIRQLLAEGKLSQRKIAEQVGVSRGSVASVARGPRPDYESIRRERAVRAAEQEPLKLGPLARCSTCGGKVYMPCRLCALQGQWVDVPRGPGTPSRVEPLGVELRGEARARYEAVHLARMQEGELTEESPDEPPNDHVEWPDDYDEDWQ